MKKNLLPIIVAVLACGTAIAQPQSKPTVEPLSYFMPDEWQYTLDEAIPTPADVLGFEVGEQHVSWDQVVAYMKALEAASPRVVVKQYGKTYEDRPMLCVVITSEKNQQNIDEIQAAHKSLADPTADVNPKELPGVACVMNTVHGNEPTGVNSSLPFAYFFAAAQGSEIEDLLDNTVILLVPGQNPDGITRFATWVNSNRSLTDVTDPNSREFDEPWPGARSNHYWHDLNRDWVNVTQPEMKALQAIYHDWMPNTVDDHHEMSSNTTFFLEPHDPVCYYPGIPQENRDLTLKVSQYNMKALDRIGSLYLSKDLFDSYSLGTGDVHSDVLGSIAMLFEQAAPGGRSMETQNGILTFAFGIRNQIVCAYGGVKAAYEMREELNTYMHDFATKYYKEAQSLSPKGYVFDGNGSEAVAYHFVEMMKAHDFQINKLAKDVTVDGHTYKKENSYLIPMAQKHSILLRSMLECNTEFEDSLFYDVSTWNMAEAYGLKYAPVKSIAGLAGDEVIEPVFPEGKVIGGKSEYAYLFDNKEYYAPYMINALQEGGLKVMVSGTGTTSPAGYSYGPGMLIVPVKNQEVSPDSVYTLISSVAKTAGIKVRAITTSQCDDFDIGHFYNQTLQKASIAIIISERIYSDVYGSAWYLLDNKYLLKPTLLDESGLMRADLSRYNTIIVCAEIGDNEMVNNKLASWVKLGGTLVTIGNGYKTANKIGVADIKTVDLASPDPATYVDYDKRMDLLDKYNIPGTDLQVYVDTTHPVGWGYKEAYVPVMKKSRLVFETPAIANEAPVCFDKIEPLLSGFIRPEQKEALAGKPEVLCSKAGKGTVISFSDDPNFRSVWYAGTKMFMNSVLFGNLVMGGFHF